MCKVIWIIGAAVKGRIDVGPKKLRKVLSNVQKDVAYCGDLGYTRKSTM